MTSVCENKNPICKASSECKAKEAIQSLNKLLLNTIEEIDENNTNCSTNVTTKWKHLATTINEAYKIVLSQNSLYGDISSDITTILNGEQICEENTNTKEKHKSTLKQKGLKNHYAKIDEEDEYSLSSAEETSSKGAEQNKEESLQYAFEFENTTDQLVSETLKRGNISTDHLELLENFQLLETTTNKLVQEYLCMHDKTLSFMDSQNRNSTLSQSDSLSNEVGDLIQQLNTSISEFTDIESDLAKATESPMKRPDNNSMHDNCSNTEVKMYILHRKISASRTNITDNVSSESLIIKTPSTEFSINLYEKNENIIRVIKETVQDFQGYMKRIKERIDRTKRDFNVLRTMLEGTILDCENNIIKAKSSKIKSIKSKYNFPP